MWLVVMNNVEQLLEYEIFTFTCEKRGMKWGSIESLNTMNGAMQWKNIVGAKKCECNVQISNISIYVLNYENLHNDVVFVSRDLWVTL